MLPSLRRARVRPRPPTPLRPPTQNCGPVYRRRRPTLTPLYPLVQHHLESFLAQATEADPMGGGVPSWVERDFRDHASRGAPCAAASSPMDSHEPGVPVVATTFFKRLLDGSASRCVGDSARPPWATSCVGCAGYWADSVRQIPARFASKNGRSCVLPRIYTCSCRDSATLLTGC